MPWVEEVRWDGGLKGRENLGAVDPTPSKSLAALQAAGGRIAPFTSPRVSAYGLNPGLRSPGPLGRWGQHG